MEAWNWLDCFSSKLVEPPETSEQFHWSGKSSDYFRYFLYQSCFSFSLFGFFVTWRVSEWLEFATFSLLRKFVPKTSWFLDQFFGGV